MRSAEERSRGVLDAIDDTMAPIEFKTRGSKILLCNIVAEIIEQGQREAAEEMREQCAAIAKKEFNEWKEDVTEGADPYDDSIAAGLCTSSDILEAILALPLPKDEKY